MLHKAVIPMLFQEIFVNLEEKDRIAAIALEAARRITIAKTASAEA